MPITTKVRGIDALAAFKKFFPSASPEEVARAAGAIDDSHVEFDVTSKGNLSVSIEHPYLKAFRSFYKAVQPDGSSVLTIIHGSQKTTDHIRGSGHKRFNEVIPLLKKLGVGKIIIPEATGSKYGGSNGYYTWPRFGFDTEMTEEQFDSLPKDIQQQMGKKRDMHTLFSLPNGPKTWEEEGSSLSHMSFDLNDNSEHMKRFKDYYNDKTKKETAGSVPTSGDRDGNSAESIQTDSTKTSTTASESSETVGHEGRVLKSIEQLRKKYQRIKYNKAREVHPLIKGFRIEHPLRYLTTDPQASENTKQLASTVLYDGDTSALQGLNDSLQEDNHVLQKRYNWLNAIWKIHLDDAVGHAIDVVAKRSPIYNDYKRWALTDAVNLLQATNNGWVNEAFQPIIDHPEQLGVLVDPSREALQELLKHHKTDDIAESLNRHSLRLSDSWVLDHEPTHPLIINERNNIVDNAINPHLYNISTRIKSSQYSRVKYSIKTLRKAYNSEFNKLANKLNETASVPDLDTFQNTDHFSKIMKVAGDDIDKASDIANILLYRNSGRGTLYNHKPNMKLADTFNFMLSKALIDYKRQNMVLGKHKENIKRLGMLDAENDDISEEAAHERIRQGAGRLKVMTEEQKAKKKEYNTKRRAEVKTFTDEEQGQRLLNYLSKKPEGVPLSKIIQSGLMLSTEKIKELAEKLGIPSKVYTTATRTHTKYFPPGVTPPEDTYLQQRIEKIKSILDAFRKDKKSFKDIASSVKMSESSIRKIIRDNINKYAKDKKERDRAYTKNRYYEFKNISDKDASSLIMAYLKNRPDGMTKTELIHRGIKLPVARVTQLLDGMNLQSKEYIATNRPITKYFHPDHTPPADVEQETKDNMSKEMLQQQQQSNMSLGKLADLYGIPKSTVRDRLNKIKARLNQPQKFSKTKGSLDFVSALRRVNSSQQQALRHVAKTIHEKMGLVPSTVRNAIHDTETASIANVAQAIYHGDYNDAVTAAARYGLLSQSPALLVFHPGKGPDVLYKVSVGGSGESLRATLDKLGIKQRVLIPTKKGWEVLIFTKDDEDQMTIRKFSVVHGGILTVSRGTGEIIGGSDQPLATSETRRSYRQIIAKSEREVNANVQSATAGNQRPSAIANTNATGSTPIPTTTDFPGATTAPITTATPVANPFE